MEWTAQAAVGRRGLRNVAWLKNPDGQIEATFKSLAVAGQCAAAMNLTTTKQRVEFACEKAGYAASKPTRAT